YSVVLALRKQKGDKQQMINYLKKSIVNNKYAKISAKEDEDFKEYWDDPEFIKLTAEESTEPEDVKNKTKFKCDECGKISFRGANARNCPKCKAKGSLKKVK
ncbi:MAG: hypothetical protein K8S87_06265, partial [Planctomycetes bacterium]|nr:hypothetical protein [Planctomycetota bacterium]